MFAKSKFNHTAAGLLGRFISRNNDIDGYWGLGVLYMEARASGNRLVLDLLEGSAEPPSPVCTGAARTWAHYLRAALAGHGLAADALAAATLSIDFDLPGPKRPPCIPHGDPFECVVHLRSADGRDVIRREIGYCLPWDQFHGSRSTRWPG